VLESKVSLFLQKFKIMKKILLFILCPFFLFGQTQIGQDIIGDLKGNNSNKIVSLSGDGSVIAIQSPLENGDVELQGIVRIYKNTQNTNVWTQIGSDIKGENSFDAGYRFDSNFLITTSISLNFNGSIVAIGASGNDGNGENSGHVRVFENINNIWTQIGLDIDGEEAGDQSGSAISLNSNGNIVAIGAIRNDGNGGNSGHVRIFENVNNIWTQIGLDIDGEESGDRSGNSISLNSDGNLIAISAFYNDGNGTRSGHLRIFRNTNSNWVQVGNDIDGESSFEYSGSSVSLSSDGIFIAVGASSNGDNGLNSGHVKIYEIINNIWTQIGSKIKGKATFDYSGESVSLSSDGSILAIGAPGNDENGDNSGHVRIYKNINGNFS
jgi:Flp pilus assembly pilin Flp